MIQTYNPPKEGEYKMSEMAFMEIPITYKPKDEYKLQKKQSKKPKTTKAKYDWKFPATNHKISINTPTRQDSGRRSGFSTRGFGLKRKWTRPKKLGWKNKKTLENILRN